MFEHTMCSSNLQGNGTVFQASDLSPFFNKRLMFASVYSLGPHQSQLTAGIDAQIWGLTLSPIPLGL